MNLEQIKARVRRTIRDDAGQFIADDDITDWANEAYLDLVARYQLLKTRANGVTSSTGTIDVPDDLLRPLWLALDGSTAPLEFVDDDVWHSWQLVTDSSPSPGLAHVFDHVIELWPASTSTGYTLEYSRTPTLLTLDPEIPELPEHLHVKLQQYAQAHAMLKSDDMARYTEYAAMYHYGLPAPPGIIHEDRPGPLHVTAEPGYFDSPAYLD